ncbi:MAG: gamma carbonic anhydrase family protein [Planctomycetota bacterium]|nr:gamma carbonic anhydrase family protein [Planctomycetota bacterium]
MPHEALVLPYHGRHPRFGPAVFVAPTAVVIGDVELGPRASVWYGAVLRGDVHSIRVGEDSNVQDGAVLHGTLGEFPVLVGARVSIGHQATVHGATLEDDVLIGIGARILDGSRIGSWSLVAAGALVREGMVVPPRSLVVGVPGVVKRELTDREIDVIRRTPERYRMLAAEHARILGEISR